jgi:hypothetical protein
MTDDKKPDEPMSRQVRRQLERNGSLRSAHDKAEDMRIAAIGEDWRRAQERRDAAARARGKRNIYICEECYGHIVTCDAAEGVTPFMIGCKATADCKGMMQSSMYRVFDQRMRPDFEWYSPTLEEATTLSPWVQEHVAKGGLVLRDVRSK